MIIDQLQDEPKALKTCSLVCQNWLPRSSKHLFASSIHALAWPRLWDFLDDLQNHGATRIHRFAREISFDFEDSENNRDCCDVEELALGVLRILRLLPGLQAVDIRGDGAPHVKKLIPNQLLRFSEVKSLKLSRTSLTGFLIQSYEHIDTLDLDLRNHPIQNLFHTDITSRWPTVTNVRLKNPSWSNRPVWFSLLNTSSPRTLSILFDRERPQYCRVDALNELLGYVKSTLVEFSLRYPPVASSGTFSLHSTHSDWLIYDHRPACPPKLDVLLKHTYVDDTHNSGLRKNRKFQYMDDDVISPFEPPT